MVQRCHLAHAGRLLSRLAIDPAASTISAFTVRPTAICTAPRVNPWAVVWPRAGSMNCGMRARYKMATFGLSRLVISPIRSSLQCESRWRLLNSNNPRPPCLSACQARNAR